MMKSVKSRIFVSMLSLALLMPAASLPRAHAAATLDVTSYGAVGSGTGDDLAAIQSAINAASAGDTVYFPAGTYYISGTIDAKSGVKLQGQSRDTAIIKFAGASDANMISLSNKTDVEVTGLTIDANNNNHAVSGIWSEPGDNQYIHDNRFKDLSKTDGFAPFGILFSDTTNSSISGNDFSNMGTGSMWGAAIRAGWGSDNVTITDNTIDSTGRGGIFVNDGVDGAIVTGNTITHSGIYNEGLAIELHTDVVNAIVEDNVVDHWISVVRSQYDAIRRNTIHTTDGTVKGIGLEIMSTHSVTTDNLVDGGQQVGMQQSPGDGYQYWGYNTVKNMVMWGMQLQGDGAATTEQYQYFYKNIIEDTPSDNPDAAYPGYAGNAVRIHGNSQNLTFDSNQIINNGRKGIEITTASGTDRLSFINNTITGNAAESIDQYPSGASDLEWSGNTVSGNGTNTQLTSRGFSDPKPTAGFTAPAAVSLGSSVTFTNTSTDNGSIAENLWDFGEGVPSTAVSPTYTYQKAGTYRVTLVVWDNNGRANIAKQTIVVSAGPPDTQAPTAPTGLTSPSKTDTTVSLSWTASTDNVGVTGYEIYRGGTLCGTSATTSFTCTGLTASTAYSFTVKAKDLAGNVSSASSALNVTTSAPDTQAPTAPTGLTSPSKTDTTVSLSWTASTDNFGVTGYEIYRGGTLCGTSATTSFTCTGLLPSTAYSFTVKAKDAAGNLSSASSALNVTTQALITGTITREYWTGVSGDSLSGIDFNSTPTGTSTLTSLKGPTNWGDNYADRIRGYIIPSTTGTYTFSIAGDNNSELWLSTNDNPANKAEIGYVTDYVNEDDWSAHSYQTSGSISMTAGQKYYVEVLHKEGSGGDHVSVGWTGPGISTRIVVPGANLAPYYGGGGGSDTQAPTAPTGLTSPSKTASSVSLSWTASTDNVGVTGYDVYKDGVLDGSTTGATTYTASGLSASTAYSFTVKAKDAAGNVSSASSALSVTTSASADTQAPTAPTGLASPSKTSSSVSLSWTASTDNVGVTDYNVYKDGTLDGTTSGAAAYTASGLSASTAYSFTVKAKDAAGNLSSASSALSVTTNASSSTGSVVREYWTGVTGNNVSDVDFNTTPSGTSTLTSLKGPTNWGDNYATRIRGYIVPSTTGSYTFSVAGDNNSEFWLSTDDNPANKVKVSYVVDWVNEDDWTARTTQDSGSISLTAGHRYYFEVLHKEANGGDHISVGWTGPGISTRVVVPGANLAAY